METLQVIYNPTAGGRKRELLEKTLSILKDRGFNIDLKETKAVGDAESFAKNADTDIVVAAGGDGTISEAINGIASREKPIPFAIIPMGTANVLAVEAGIEKKAEKIAEVIVRKNKKEISFIRANDRCVIAMASAGFDSYVVDNVSLKIKKSLGKGAYVLSALKSLFTYDYPLMKIETGNTSKEAYGIIICKGRFFAGKYLIFPEANLEEKLFHVCLMKNKGFFSTLKYSFAMVLNRLDRLKDVEVFEAEKIKITSDKKAVFEADGDVLCDLPVDVSIEKKQLQMLM